MVVDGAAEDINEVWHGGNASEQSVRTKYGRRVVGWINEVDWLKGSAGEVNKAEKGESRNGKCIPISGYQPKSQE